MSKKKVGEKNGIKKKSDIPIWNHSFTLKTVKKTRKVLTETLISGNFNKINGKCKKWKREQLI